MVFELLWEFVVEKKPTNIWWIFAEKMKKQILFCYLEDDPV